MKDKLNEKINKLKDLESPYYCGSSCLLSLEILLKEYRLDFIDFDEAFEDIFPTIDSLFDEDTFLFGYSQKKEELTKEEWDKVKKAIDDYAYLLSLLNQLSKISNECMKEDYALIFNEDFLFLAEIVRSVLAIYLDREDKTEEFIYSANMALNVIQEK